MRRFTLITIICLLALLAAAAIYQIVLASRNHKPYPGPVSGTPFPSTTVTATP